MALTLAEAVRIVEGAIARARELNLHVSVTVCDQDGHLLVLNRMDGTFATATRGSIGKAIASATSGRPSGEIEAYVNFSLPNGTVIGEGAPVIRRKGGIPIVREDILEGACGVSGAGDNEQDEECARAGVAALESG